MTYVPRASWKRLYTLNFAAAGTQDLSAGGPFTIDGKTWTVENQANANSVKLNGTATGLEIDTKSGAATFSNGTRTAALIRVDLGSLITSPTFALARAYRFRVQHQVVTMDANFKFTHVGIEWGTTPANFYANLGRGFSTSACFQAFVATSATQTGSAVLTSGTSDDVMDVIWRPHWNWEFRTGVYGSEFPKSTTFRASMTSSMSANVMRETGTPNARLFMASAPNGAGTGFVSRFLKLAVDQLVA